MLDNNQRKESTNKENGYVEIMIKVQLTKVQFSNEEVEVLEKGLKYAPRKRINKEEILIQCEGIVERMKKEDDKKCIHVKLVIL